MNITLDSRYKDVVGQGQNYRYTENYRNVEY